MPRKSTAKEVTEQEFIKPPISSASQKKSSQVGSTPSGPLAGGATEQRLIKPRKTIASQKKTLQAGSTPSGRRADLAKVHIAKRDLKLTDQLYRGFLNVLFGETSAKDLTHEQIDELLDHFKSLGWESGYAANQTKAGIAKARSAGGSQGSTSSGNGSASMKQLGLIMYLWKHGPGIRNKSTQALDHFLNHHFHVAELKQVKARQVPGILGAIKNMGKL